MSTFAARPWPAHPSVRCCSSLSASNSGKLFSTSLIPETLEGLAERSNGGPLSSQTLKDVGQQQLTQIERNQRRRALSDLGIPEFYPFLSQKGISAPLKRTEMGTLQLNIGLYCNQACSHCHVESSPLRTEMMTAETAKIIIALLEKSPSIHTVDITGGAPELNSQFRYIVTAARRLGRKVIDRCNLTVLLEPGQEDLAQFLADNKVNVVASLPCYSSENVEKQRGRGVFDRSILGLKMLNDIGYGKEGSGLVLDLVYNPVGAFLPGPQSALEQAYKKELLDNFDISFNNLFTITNMPIKRFADMLHKEGKTKEYLNLLVSSFNLSAVQNMMCTNLISVRWDGALFDCDFNQQLAIGVLPNIPKTVSELNSFEDLIGQNIACDNHCFGCTAGQGSSCTGAVAS